MLLLTVIAFLSTMAFYRRAKHIGVSPGRSASLPFIVLGFLLVLAFVAVRLIAYIGGILAIGDRTLLRIEWMFNWSLILAYLSFIRKNWQALNQPGKAEEV